MTPDEIDIALSDLTVRMERVRSLYEQYFMGMERIAPLVPRKELERRMEHLRKTRFPNTARRFKFQTLVQRYTSLSQYWNRTTRDIENGTYRKHLDRAKKRFGEDISPHQAANDKDEAIARAERASDAKKQAADDLAAMLDSDIDLNAEMENALSAFEDKAEPTQSPAAAAAAAASASTSTSTSTGKGLLGALGKRDTQSQARPTEAARAGLQLPKSPSLEQKTTEERSRTGTRSIAAASPTPATRAAAQGSARPGSAGPPVPPPRRNAPPQTTATNKPSSPAARPAPPPRPTAKEGTASATSGGAPRPAAPAPRPAAPAPRPAAPAPRPAAPAARPPVPATKPATPAPRPATPAARPATPAARPAPAARANQSPQQLSDERIRAIHQSYQDARSKTNAQAVSFEKLQKSLRETEQQLRAKHRGKNVDFDVSIKDGKAILRPKLK